MFRGLRNRFVILHMGIVTLVVVIFFGTILISNYQDMQKRADEILSRASEPKPEPPKGMPPSGRGPEPRFSPVFTVELDAVGNIIHVISSFTLEDEFYQEVKNLAVVKKKDTGVISYGQEYFKYKFTGDRRIIFLDITKDVGMFTNTIYTFTWIAFPLLLIIFLISLYFANRSIKPVEEAYNKQKQFIEDASHELKTPLAVISTNTDILLESSSGEHRKWLGYIKSETERMAGLTSSLLFLAKLDYVEEKSLLASIDFSRLLEDYLIPLEALFFENKIETQIDIQSGVNINGDGEQIRRLIGTLIDNAIKYTDGNIKVTLKKDEPYAKLTVSNTGKGIDASELRSIWDRFYRGDKSRGSTGGFGLGLPIAKSIAERHKGGITAESNENEWTNFVLKLPLEK